MKGRLFLVFGLLKNKYVTVFSYDSWDRHYADGSLSYTYPRIDRVGAFLNER